ncbi:hypothetical protein MMC20_004399 [Loxospora ochrophaea]|nr:hypothetical protein [Loxospora ochrophaea]
MQNPVLLPVVAALFSASGALGQAASSSADALNQFIGAAGTAVNVISAAQATETPSSTSSASSTTPTTSVPSTTSAAPSPSSTAPAPSNGLSSRTRLIIIIVCVVVGILLLALLAGCICCCLARRRRRRRTVTPIHDDEVNTWRSPTNPGRTYVPVDSQTHDPYAGRSPTVPDMAMVNNAPPLDQHPAHRPQNPFVPVPPQPRKAAPNARAGLTDGTIPGDDPYIGAIAPTRQVLRKSHSQSRSRSGSSGAGLNDSFINQETSKNVLPTHNTDDRPPTPFGLSGIGRPYDDTHVHLLQDQQPSQELRNSLYNRQYNSEYEPVPPPVHEPVERFSTPPNVPSRSPKRSHFHDSTYDSSDPNGNSSSEESWQTSQMGTVPSSQPSYIQPQQDSQPRVESMQAPPIPWDDNSRHRSYSNSPVRSSFQGPSVPWQDGRERRYSGSPREQWSRSPRQSFQGGQRGSGQSGTGNGKRLRFSDLEGNNQAWSQGVGEAL